eukprot:10284656-Prorocentrum_lima.AAC.1
MQAPALEARRAAPLALRGGRSTRTKREAHVTGSSFLSICTQHALSQRHPRVDVDRTHPSATSDL